MSLSISPFSAEALAGTTINPNVTGSSLTSVGTLGSLTVTGNVTGNTAPTSAAHLTTKSYVDNAILGLSWKHPADVATTAALPACTYANGTAGVGATLTANANAVITAQDGVTITVGMRLLVKDQASTLQNGIYTVTSIGAAGAPWVLTRATDFDGVTPLDEVNSAAVFVSLGTTLHDTAWTEINNVVTIGTDAVAFAQFAATTGPYVRISGDTMTGPLTLSYTAPYFTINTTTTASNGAFVLQDNGLNRWAIVKNSTAESGSNVGSNLQLNRYTDAGAYLDSPLVINRASGQTTLSSLFIPTVASGDQLIVQRSTPQYLTINNSNASPNPTISSYSDPANAKQMIFNTTTDIANTALTAGALGYLWQVYGATKATLSDVGTLTITGNLYAASGAAAAPSISFSSATGVGLFQSGGSLALSTAGTERIRIDTNGLVGIGGGTATGYTVLVSKNMTGSTSTYGIVSSGVIQADVTASAYGFQSTISTVASGSYTLANLIHFVAGSGSGVGVGSAVNQQIGFLVNGNMTGGINNYGFFGNLTAAAGRYNFYAPGTADNYFAGNVGVGTAVPTFQLDVQGTSGAAVAFTRYTNTNASTALFLQHSRGATVGSNVIVQNNDTLGTLMFSGANGTGFDGAASIVGMVDAVPGASTNMPGRLVFSTTPTSSATPIERMRIDSSGSVSFQGLTQKSVTTGISAAGTTQGTATALTKEINVVSTVTAGAGVILPSSVGTTFIVINTGANALLVYPVSGAAIDGGTANAALSMPPASRIMFIQTSSTAYYTLNATYS